MKPPRWATLEWKAAPDDTMGARRRCVHWFDNGGNVVIRQENDGSYTIFCHPHKPNAYDNLEPLDVAALLCVLYPDKEEE